MSQPQVASPTINVVKLDSTNSSKPAELPVLQPMTGGKREESIENASVDLSVESEEEVSEDDGLSSYDEDDDYYDEDDDDVGSIKSGGSSQYSSSSDATSSEGGAASTATDDTIEKLSADPLFLVLSSFLMSGDHNLVDAVLKLNRTLHGINKSLKTLVSLKQKHKNH
jgi:hypothetical protein